MSFDDFSRRTGIKSKGGVPCLTCQLPAELRTEVEDLRKRLPPVSYVAISKYLGTDHKLKISNSALLAHFRKGHAE